MRIHALMDCSLVNGPGGRAVVWFQGCEIHCPGCWNQSTHRRNLGLAICDLNHKMALTATFCFRFARVPRRRCSSNSWDRAVAL